jgi:hypothetical protein
MSQPSAATQLYAATTQIAKANLPWVAGGLNRFEDAEDRELFAMPPVDDGGAYRHAAYWQAVASRLLASTELLNAAIDAERKAMSVSLLSFGDAQAPRILAEAASNVNRAVATSAGDHRKYAAEANRVQSILSQYATPSAISVAQHDDDSYTGWMRQFQKNLQKAGKVAVFVAVGLGASALGALVWFVSRRWKVRRNPLGIARAVVRTARRITTVAA